MSWMTHVAARPGGDLIAVTTSEGWLGIWLPMDNRIAATHALGDTIHKVGWTFDGAYLLATVEDSLVVLSGDGRERLATIATGHGGVRTFACHPSQQVVATTGDDGVVRLWDIASGTKRGDLMEKAGKGSGGGTAVALSEQTVVVGYRSGWFATCDPDGANVGAAQLFGGNVSALARVLPERASFVAGGGQGKMVQLVIEPDTFRIAQTWNHPPRPISTNTIEFAPDGRFVTACSDDTACLFAGTHESFPTTLGSAFWLARKPWQQDYIVSAACFVPNTKLIATSHFTGCVKLWHVDRTYSPVEVRFVDDQPRWSADGQAIDDPIARWPELR